MLIRAATVEDAPLLCEAEAAIAETPGLLVSRPDEISVTLFEKRIHDLQVTGCYVVADTGEHVVGHAVLEPMQLVALRHVYRLTIVVHPGHSGRGVGAELLQHVQHWARSHPQLRKIELLVRSTNVRAINLYRRFGFVQEGVLRDRVRLSDGVFVDDVAMAWFPARAE